MSIRRMIGDVLAARVKDGEKTVLEVKTDGRCQLLGVDIDKTCKLFCESFSVPTQHRSKVIDSIQTGKFDPDFLHNILTKQLGKSS